MIRKTKQQRAENNAAGFFFYFWLLLTLRLSFAYRLIPNLFLSSGALQFQSCGGSFCTLR